MYRTLRAFAWMRWRILVNSMERTGARDRLERFSIAIEQLGPIVAAIVMIPSVLVLSGVSAAAGYILASAESTPVLIQVVRYLLLAATAFSLIGPLLLPAADRSNAVRLLLLPIPRTTLYASQAAATLSDPWVLLVVPIVLFLPVGLALGGAVAAAVTALAAGILFLLFLTGVTTLTTSALQVIVRDRRRGELLALLFVIVVPLLGTLPAALGSRPRPPGEPQRHSHQPAPAWVVTTVHRASLVAPSEMYFRSLAARSQSLSASSRRVAGLAAVAATVHLVGLFVFGRVLASPGATTVRRARSSQGVWSRTLPLTSPPASAIALAQLRLALRTPRGRSILLSPVVVFVMFSIVARRAGDAMDFGFTSVQGGLGFAAFGCFISLVATLPILMNQFAVDRAGLTLMLLAPLTARQVLRGKAIGNALVALIPSAVCLAGGMLVFGGGSAAAWTSIPLAMIAAYVVVAPIASMCSAVFPRAVDMNSIGRNSNAHGMAGLIGMGSYVAAALPAMLLFLYTSAIRRPTLLPVLLLLWCAVAFALSRLLFIPAERIFERRRENLALVV